MIHLISCGNSLSLLQLTLIMPLSLPLFHLLNVLVNPSLLPDQLPNQYLGNQGFISFEEPQNTFTPLFSSLTVNGVSIGSQGSLSITDVFTASTFASLPNQTAIEKLKDSSGREVWNYPIGTEVAHEILFNDLAHSVYELRILRKISDSEWDYASYSPSPAVNSDHQLIRNHYSGTAELATTLQLNNGTAAKIDLRRINLNSCKRCHSMNSIAAYQYPNANSAGPCGFTPGNDSGIQTWIQKFEEKFGHSPFR